jgi:phosphotransacetylase
MSVLIEKFRQKCIHKPKRIVFTDTKDVNVLLAARYLFDEKLAFPVLLGAPSEIRDFAEQAGLHTRGLRIQHPMHTDRYDLMIKDLHNLGQWHGMTRFDAEEKLRQPLTMGAMLVRHKQADVCISGNLSTAENVLRTAISILGNKEYSETVSGYFLMMSPDKDKLYAFADCTVIPVPSSNQLAEIAVTTAENYKSITGFEPRVAMLSFSTNKSSDHDMAQKVREAVQTVKDSHPSLILDGEVQFDAAIDCNIMKKKAPECRLEGKANVFIFPSLHAGNIAYQIARHLAGYQAIGPLLQGLDGNMHYIPGNSSAEDMINLALIASCL